MSQGIVQSLLLAWMQIILPAKEPSLAVLSLAVLVVLSATFSLCGFSTDSGSSGLTTALSSSMIYSTLEERQGISGFRVPVQPNPNNSTFPDDVGRSLCPKTLISTLVSGDLTD